ncbi:RSP_7527 family protein [Marinomonas sp. IMCC 4694]|uniref:RSP_7527 family protein n=1 Tax=Marinomonas sp. IMCC 4694 TaxID=2605432 RepID=UPI0011E608C9|nr:hypothetical protein [Marinomonas sp. IMCC 4694]TYL48399.1 hypothetical protein FXV75_10865 [Marinomonas sp. IMCC 4694]
MNNTKSIVELLDNVNIDYLTDAEKYEMIARAERSEYIVASIASAVASVKKAVFKMKSAFVSSSAQHA